MILCARPHIQLGLTLGGGATSGQGSRPGGGACIAAYPAFVGSDCFSESWVSKPELGILLTKEIVTGLSGSLRFSASAPAALRQVSLHLSLLGPWFRLRPTNALKGPRGPEHGTRPLCLNFNIFIAITVMLTAV